MKNVDKRPHVISKAKKHARHLRAVVFVLCVMAIVCFTYAVASQTSYIIVDGDKEIEFDSHSKNAESILQQVGIELGVNDSYHLGYSHDNVLIYVDRAFPISICADGVTSVHMVTSGTVYDALQLAGISYGKNDTINFDLDAEIQPGMEIVVVKNEVRYTTVETVLKFETVYNANSNLDKGVEEVVREGSDGLMATTYKQYFSDGLLVEMVPVSERVLTEPQARLIDYGTKVETPKADKTNSSSSNKNSGGSSSSNSGSSSSGSGTVTMKNGTVLKFKRSLNMSASAYTTENSSNKVTASGEIARVGIVAADFSTLPMGTKVYIVSAYGDWEYGIAVVGDTGVKGNKIDLFYNTYDECIQFGRRDAIVYILE